MHFVDVYPVSDCLYAYFFFKDRLTKFKKNIYKFYYKFFLSIHFFTFTCLLMYMINILVISGRACSRRMTGAQVLALMDDSDMELSDSDCELDVGDTDSSNGADDTGDSESERKWHEHQLRRDASCG